MNPENENWLSDCKGTRSFPVGPVQGVFMDMLVCVFVYVESYRKGEKTITYIYLLLPPSLECSVTNMGSAHSDKKRNVLGGRRTY